MNNPNNNILIVCGDWYAKTDGDTNIAKKITNKFVIDGYNVTVLSLSREKTKRIKCENGYYLHCFSCNQKLNNLEKAFRSSTRIKKIRCMIKHPFFLLAICYMKYKSILSVNELYYYRHIRKITNRLSFSRIIAITYPNETAEAVSKFSNISKTVWLQLDVCALSRTQRIVEKVSSAIVPFPIFYFYSNNGIKGLEKIKAAGIPNIAKPVSYKSADNVVYPNKMVNIAYIGRLNEINRRPEPFLKISEFFDNTLFAFHIIGEGCEEILNDFQKNHTVNLLLHGNRSLESALNAMQTADFLVNIDNEKEYELFFPSKINDYISTGKPIINIYSNPNSFVLDY